MKAVSDYNGLFTGARKCCGVYRVALVADIVAAAQEKQMVPEAWLNFEKTQ